MERDQGLQSFAIPNFRNVTGILGLKEKISCCFLSFKSPSSFYLIKIKTVH